MKKMKELPSQCACALFPNSLCDQAKNGFTLAGNGLGMSWRLMVEPSRRRTNAMWRLTWNGDILLRYNRNNEYFICLKYEVRDNSQHNRLYVKVRCPWYIIETLREIRNCIIANRLFLHLLSASTEIHNIFWYKRTCFHVNNYRHVIPIMLKRLWM